jgi:riboflavin synthase
MFTGLIQDLGLVQSIVERPDGREVVVKTKLASQFLGDGASVACNGVCLTVVRSVALPPSPESEIVFFVGPETLAKTAFGQIAVGSTLNLEPALRMGDPLGGHVVLGHVDGCATVVAHDAVGEARILSLRLEPQWMDWVVPTGSIAVRGTSLTVAGMDDEECVIRIMLIPHTLSWTNLGELRPGHRVEIECDTQVKALVRTVARMLPAQLNKLRIGGAPL